MRQYIPFFGLRLFVEKGSLMSSRRQSFYRLLGCIRMGLGPGTFPCQETESSELVLGLSPCVGITFSVSDSMCTPLFYLSMCIIWCLANLTISVLFVEGTEPFYCSTRGVHADQLPCTFCQEGPASHGDSHPLLEMILLFPCSVRVKCCSI